MIKVLLIGMSSNVGGIETYLYNLVKKSDKNKFRFDFIDATNSSIAMKNEIEELGCNIYKIIPRNKSYLKHKQSLIEIFKEKYDYIHINIMSYSWYEPIIFANKYSEAKIIVHSHCANDGFLKKNHLRTRILNKIGKFKCRNIPYLRVACGTQAGKFMFGNNKFQVFNNGIDFEKFKFSEENRKKIRNELDILENTKVYGNVAAFLKTKNHDFLIDIFNEIHKQNKNSKLILVGEGLLKSTIEKKVKNLNLEKDVLFLGKRNDVNEIYSAMDAIIMPSFMEGLSISLIEAQVNGLNCYISDVCDKNSNITKNVEFISLNESAKKWSEKINAKRNKHNENVLEKIPDEFNAKESYKMVYEFYENMR